MLDDIGRVNCPVIPSFLQLQEQVLDYKCDIEGKNRDVIKV